MQPITQNPLHERIITQLAEITGVDATELEPLYNSIDPEAIDALYANGRDSVSKLVFDHADCQVTVDEDQRIEISPVTHLQEIPE